MLSAASTKYYEPIGIPKNLLDGCQSFTAYYKKETVIYPEDDIITKIKRYALFILLYIPIKIVSCLSDRLVLWYGTPIPPDEYETKKRAYSQLFDFGYLENPESHIDKLIAKRLPSLNFSQVYIFQIRANQSNRLFAPDGRRAADLPKLLSLRDNNARVLFCAYCELSTTMEDFWEGTLQGQADRERTSAWIRQRCVSIIDYRSLDSLYEQLKTLS
jgi:hypothetical protein